MKAAAVPVGMSWMWTLAFGYHEDRTPTHGYAATREAAMAGGHCREALRSPSLERAAIPVPRTNSAGASL